MNEPRTQQEPSMEEILASIRRIISEDGVEESGEREGNGRADEDVGELAADPATPDSAAPDDGFGGRFDAASAAEGDDGPDIEDSDDDVLELTDIVEDAAPEPTPRRGAPARAPQAPAATPTSMHGPDDDRLMSAAAAAAASGAFAKMHDRPAYAKDIGSMPVGDGNTVEDIVRDLLRPMLREWLDANLPGLVEDLVKRELDAIARDTARR